MQYSVLYPGYWQWLVHFQGIRLSHDTIKLAKLVYSDVRERWARTVADEINPKVYVGMVLAIERGEKTIIFKIRSGVVNDICFSSSTINF